MPTALVVRTAGTNCDAELCRAFELAAPGDPRARGPSRRSPALIDDIDLIGFPGGFSHGDDVASGRILAVKLRERLYPALAMPPPRRAHDRCLQWFPGGSVQVGLLPGPAAGQLARRRPAAADRRAGPQRSGPFRRPLGRVRPEFDSPASGRGSISNSGARASVTALRDDAARAARRPRRGPIRRRE